jgi:hypothetical protein
MDDDPGDFGEDDAKRRVNEDALGGAAISGRSAMGIVGTGFVSECNSLMSRKQLFQR